MVILGFDPGGEGHFGWCVAEATTKGRLRMRASGIKDHAEGAVTAALEKAAGNVEAAGIDSPLLWVTDGDRKADKIVRSAIRQFGAKYVDGTVQRVNSLRGACLSQGIMAAHLLRSRLPGIRITESHPKALLWLLRVASQQRAVAEVRISDLGGLIECKPPHPSESDHVRDAALGAVAALAMIERRIDWRNLYGEEEEKNAFTPVSPVEYWMPS